MTSPFPLEKLKQEINNNPHDLLQLFLSPHDLHHHKAAASTTSLSKPPTNSFNINSTRQVQTLLITSHQHHHKVEKNKSHGDGELFRSSSSSSMADESHGANKAFLCYKREYRLDDDHHHHQEIESTNDDGSVNWMSSKMRLMHKMMMSSNKNNGVRVCTDCNTTTTPLWRSGPLGPKSLCNACGIRQRKARRAMALAETSSSSTNIKPGKDKKSPTNDVSSKCKKQCRPPDHHHQSQKKLCLKNLALSLSKNSTFQRVLPHDVEQAAILLMELSCGLIHT